MYDIYIYANIGGILMVNVTIYSIHGSYGIVIYPHLVVIYHISLWIQVPSYLLRT